LLARRLGLLAAFCAAAAGIVYLLAIRTEWGQRADNSAFEGRLTASIEARQDADQILRLISVPSLALLGGAVMLIALWRGHWRLALAAGTAIGGAVVTTEIVKSLLERPQLHSGDPIDFNSWPSGHVTIATALSLAVIMVLPRSVRVQAAVVACVFTATFGGAAILSGWHRPADTIGGYLVALGWCSVVTAALVAWRGSGPKEGDTRGGHLPYLVVAVLALGALATLIVIVVIGRGSELSNVESSGALLLALTQVAALGVLAVATYAFVIRGAVLDPRSEPVPR
jgi:membrane-associated phospholipid phosphatase